MAQMTILHDWRPGYPQPPTERGSNGRVNGNALSLGGVVARGKNDLITGPSDVLGSSVEDIADAVVVGMLPPISDALQLADDFPDVLHVPFLASLGGYTWFSERHYNRAHCWVRGLFAAKSVPEAAVFVGNSLRDLHNMDRAERAVGTCDLRHAPMRKSAIPERKHNGSAWYTLSREPFSWSEDVPPDAVDQVVRVTEYAPPDVFWIAKYIQQRAVYDPVIYATYGLWEVEVYEWT